MERPKVSYKPKQREITGEVMYLEDMRRLHQYPTSQFTNLGDMAIDMYETEAEIMRTYGGRPGIFDEYERCDSAITDTERSCMALADELLAFKDKESQLTFVDIVVEQPAEEVLAKLEQMKVGEMLAEQDQQLAIKSDGSYYPILDAKKKDMKLQGVGLRVWGWEYPRFVPTSTPGEHSNPILFPSNEKQADRKLELTFSYAHSDTTVNECVSLRINQDSGSSISRMVLMSAYAETGYEGHGHRSLENVNDDDVAAFGDLIAEIVGDEPRTIGMAYDRILQKIIKLGSTVEVRDAMQKLADATWTAQASYLLMRKIGDESIAQIATDPDRADETIAAINELIAEWHD